MTQKPAPSWRARREPGAVLRVGRMPTAEGSAAPVGVALASAPVKVKRRRVLPKFAGLDVLRARLKRCVPLTPQDTASFEVRFAEAKAAGTVMEKAPTIGCPAAVPTPSGRCRCSVKGCGCSDLHALRADAICPLGRWA